VSLVNDLDLVVTDPTGRRYNGSVFYQGWSCQSSYKDSINNVECVYIPESEVVPGVYSVEIMGGGIVMDTDFSSPGVQQNYSLVLNADGLNDNATVAFDQAAYRASAAATVVVADLGATGPTLAVMVASPSETEQLDLARVSTGLYSGQVQLSPYPSAANDGILTVAEGDVITVTYNDPDDGTGSPRSKTDTATVDSIPPAISNVASTVISSFEVEIRWETDELSDSVVRYGMEKGNFTEIFVGGMTKDHSMRLTGLDPGMYYFEVESTDVAGNAALDDNGGGYYVFTSLVGAYNVGLYGEHLDNVSVSGNTIGRTDHGGVFIFDSTGIDVADNELYSSLGFGTVFSACNNVTIHNSVTHHHFESGFLVYDSENIAVVDCALYHNYKFGIIVSGCEHGYLSGLEVNDTWKYTAVQIQYSDEVDIEKVSCYSNKDNYRGINIYGSYNISVTNSTSARAHDGDIYVHGSYFVDVRDCTARDSYYQPFVLRNAYDTTVSNCSSIKGRDGFLLWRSINVTLENCSAVNASYKGVYVDGAKESTVINATITGHLVGVYLKPYGSAPSSNISIIGTTITEPRIYTAIGIHILKADNTRIENCTVLGDHRYGIEIFGSYKPSYVNNCTVSDGQTGIFVDGSHEANPVLEDCAVENNTEIGVFIQGRTDTENEYMGAIVKRCTVSGSPVGFRIKYVEETEIIDTDVTTTNGVGISTYDAAFRVDSSRVTDSEYGIVVEDAGGPVHVNGSTVADNAFGIWAEGSAVNVTNCTVASNRHGLHIADSHGGSRVEGNDVTDHLYLHVEGKRAFPYTIPLYRANGTGISCHNATVDIRANNITNAFRGLYSEASMLTVAGNEFHQYAPEAYPGSIFPFPPPRGGGTIGSLDPDIGDIIIEPPEPGPTIYIFDKGIYLKAGSTADVEHNTFDGHYDAIWVENSTAYIADNNLTSSGFIHPAIPPSGPYKLAHVGVGGYNASMTVDGNDFNEFPRAVYVSYSGGSAQVRGNTFWSNGRDVYSDHAAPCISGNHLAYGRGGIECHHSNASITGNIVDKAGCWLAIHDSQAPYVANNTLSDSGIWLEDSGGTVFNNSLTGEAVAVYGGSTLVSYNTVTGSQYGIRVVLDYHQGSPLTVPAVHNNTVQGNDIGIYLQGLGNAPEAMLPIDVAGNTVSGNTVGIHVNDANATIRQNAVTGNAEDGIRIFAWFNAPMPPITDNTFSGNDWSVHGIYAKPLNRDTIIGDNTFLDVGLSGWYWQEWRLMVDVADNTTSQPLAGADVTVTGLFSGTVHPTGRTDASGQTRWIYEEGPPMHYTYHLTVTECICIMFNGNPTSIYDTPHSVQVTKTGYITGTTTVTMDQNAHISVALDPV